MKLERGGGRTNGCLAPLGVGDREANHEIWYRLGLHNPNCDSVCVVEAQMKKQHRKDRGHDEVMAEAFGSDPEYAAKLAEEVLRDGEQGEIDILRRQIAIIPKKYKEK